MGGLKKGLWTAEEDKILIEHIKVHGKGRWNKAAKITGLKRSGKSCRLRWMNYLSPGIKQGAFSSDEDELIIRLHKLLGNRWSLIAGRVPGRTDNNVKNHWNTHLKKKVLIKKKNNEAIIINTSISNNIYSRNSEPAIKIVDSNQEKNGAAVLLSSCQEMMNNVSQRIMKDQTLCTTTLAEDVVGEEFESLFWLWSNDGDHNMSPPRRQIQAQKEALEPHQRRLAKNIHQRPPHQVVDNPPTTLNSSEQPTTTLPAPNTQAPASRTTTVGPSPRHRSNHQPPDPCHPPPSSSQATGQQSHGASRPDASTDDEIRQEGHGGEGHGAEATYRREENDEGEATTKQGETAGENNEEISRRLKAEDGSVLKRKDDLELPISVVGSTGSIGTQTLDIVAENPDKFRIVALANATLLADQVIIHFRLLESAFYYCEVKTFRPRLVAVRNESLIGELKEALADADYKPEIVAGEDGVVECIQGLPEGALRRILLTASGGAFRDWPVEKLKEVKVADALKHPNWNMGKKITVDSATLFNKGLEVIEAHYLFGTEYDDIEIIIHPQSIIHSMIETQDSSVLAQLGWPDMRLPILYTLSWPDRIYCSEITWPPRLDLCKLGSLTFKEPDNVKYPSMDLAYASGRAGGTMTGVLSAANEKAVEMFIDEKITCLDIFKVVELTCSKHREELVTAPSLEEIIHYDLWARQYAASLQVTSGPSPVPV
ncbi:unnamed protein product [Rhodiola kirilowii]